MSTTYLTWIFPDRGSIKESRYDEERFWSGYRRVAASYGLTVEVCSPELVDVSLAADGSATVRVDGRRATPADTVFVTEYQAFPHMARDMWWQMTSFQAVEAAGFFLPIPPRWSAIANDKLSTAQVVAPHLARTGVLPTVRVNAGRDLEERDLTELLRDISLPAVVKPTSWAGMWGLVEVRDWVELRCALRLASAADLSVVVQPRVPEARLHSYRLYCVDQHVLGAHRFGAANGHVLVGPRHGGTSERVDPPPELVEDATRIMRLIPVSYLAIDFLTDGERYWFSEVELDASVGAHNLDDPLMLAFLQRRLQCYVRDHRAWLDRGLRNGVGRVDA